MMGSNSKKFSLAIEDEDTDDDTKLPTSLGRKSSNEPLNAFLIYAGNNHHHHDSHPGDQGHGGERDMKRSVSLSELKTKAKPPSPTSTGQGLIRRYSICDLDSNSLKNPISPVEGNHDTFDQSHSHHPRRNSIALKFQPPKTLN